MGEEGRVKEEAEWKDRGDGTQIVHRQIQGVCLSQAPSLLPPFVPPYHFFFFLQTTLLWQKNSRCQNLCLCFNFRSRLKVFRKHQLDDSVPSCSFFFLTPLTSHFSISIMGIIILPLRLYKNENARICITTNTGTLHESKKCQHQSSCQKSRNWQTMSARS